MVILVYISVFKLRYIYSSIKIPSMKTNIIIIGLHEYSTCISILRKKIGLPLLHFIGLGSPKIEFWDLKVPEKSSNNY